MKYKAILLIFIINLSFISHGFCQIKKTSPIPYLKLEVVNEYNGWLKAIHLDKLIHADRIASLSASQHKGTKADNLPRLLVLTPVGQYHDPQKFATAWNLVSKGLQEQGIDIYSLLLNKLANYNWLEDKTAVEIDLQTKDPEIFSLTISYDHDGHVAKKENIVYSRGGNNVVAFNLAATINSLRENCLKINQAININGVYNRLHSLFDKYKYEVKRTDNIEPTFDNDGKGLHLIIYNIYGQVTHKNLHEVVYMDIKLQNDVMCYTVDGVYAAGILKAPDPKSESQFYRPIAVEYPQQWLIYRDNLSADLSKLLK